MRKAAAVTEFDAPDEQKPVRNRETVRKTRVPIGGDQLKLGVPNWPFPDYHGRWFEDTGARLQLAVQAGYDFVMDAEIGYSVNSDGVDGRVRYPTGRDASGRPTYSFLMRIHKDFLKEDEAAREANRKSAEAEMRKGKVGGNEGAFYTPSGQNVIKS